MVESPAERANNPGTQSPGRGFGLFPDNSGEYDTECWFIIKRYLSIHANREYQHYQV